MKKRIPLRAFTGLILIAVIGIGLLIYQRQHIQKHLPLIAAEFAAADSMGPEILAEIGQPEGAAPYDDGLKTFPGESRRSMWRGAKLRIRWERTWVLPGTHEDTDAWFDRRLSDLGWQPFTIGTPSNVEKAYWKDKWLVTIQHGADFSTDRNPTVRKTVILDWDYWHDLGR
ncbi:MAG: hypothetical protein KDN18_10365 [Verrucomicrobiae bacterium]|nr:hypothetical protein [Verrucomicrobiae bacterium]